MRRLISVSLIVSLTAILFAGPTLADGNITPGDNLVVEGIPAIPASLADEVAATPSFAARDLELASDAARDADQHPLRRHQPGASREECRAAHATQLLFRTSVQAAASYRPKTGDSFVFNRDIGGNEFFQYYRYDLGDWRR